MMIFQFILVLSLFGIFYSQDLQFECISCADKLDKCEIDCSWRLQSFNSTVVKKCHDSCYDLYSICNDSDETTMCFNCMYSCAETYDTEIRNCISYISDETKMTFGSSQSECSSLASVDMKDCMKTCSSNST